MHITLLQFYSSHPTADYDRIAAGLRDRGHTVWVATPDDDGNLVWRGADGIVATQPSPRALAPAHRLPGARRLGELRFMLSVRRFLKSQQPDIVQVNPASIHWVWLLPFFMPGGISFILDWRQIGERSSAGWLGALKWRWFSLRRYVYSRFVYDRAAFLHEAGARRVLGDGWRRRADVVPMGVDDQFLTATPAPESDSDSTQPEPKRVTRFLYLGSIARVRQLELLLAAAKELSRTTPDFELVFLGRDATGGDYARQAQAMGLTDWVRFRPPIPYEQVPDAVLAHDVALAYVPAEPADWRYHPTLKVLEYRALGVPIIATDFEPNRDEVADEVNGLLVENTVQAWAWAMARFVEDPAFLMACTANAQHMRRGISSPEVAMLYERGVYERS
jgi:glycosyltransferase involved in cell wall biosynthesis